VNLVRHRREARQGAVRLRRLTKSRRGMTSSLETCSFPVIVVLQSAVIAPARGPCAG
jgi:hypothetical protein